MGGYAHPTSHLTTPLILKLNVPSSLSFVRNCSVADLVPATVVSRRTLNVVLPPTATDLAGNAEQRAVFKALKMLGQYNAFRSRHYPFL